MFPTVYGEVHPIVIKSGGNPSVGRVAILACIGELIRYMVWVGRRIVIRLMAAHTGVWCIVVVALMAGSAIVRNGRVCPRQGIVVIVNGEGSRCPSRIGCVAGRTIVRNGQRHMVGVGTLVVMHLVTSDTSGGNIVVIASDVAFAARHSRVRARKRPHRSVIKCRRNPGILCVTLGAIGWELIRQVIRIGGCIIILLMATNAGGWRIGVIASDVTECAAVGNSSMSTIQGPHRRMIKRRGHPGILAVALRASGR